MTQPNNYVLEGVASNQDQRIIGQKIFLKSDINFMLLSKLNFNQSTKVNLKTSEAMRILSIRHVISK
jgi:hypothetical protein